MTIEAKIVCDSKAINGVRLTTFVLKYPRFIHSELMTHRAFSRNASSSRAIPFKRQMKMIKKDMAMPLDFRENKAGMQAGAKLSGFKQWLCRKVWRSAGHVAILFAKGLNWLGVHKQYVNRVVEPFAHITVVVSATEFANFFALRHHSAAQPEIAELAKQMWDLYSTNTPKELGHGEWHLPFITAEEAFEQAEKVGLVYDDCETREDYFWMQENYWMPLVKRSVAKCARTSYLNHDGTNSTIEQDLALHDRLVVEQPIHASPAEHQARCDVDWGDHCWDGNFRGWRQYRKRLANENITKFDGPLG